MGEMTQAEVVALCREITEADTEYKAISSIQETSIEGRSKDVVRVTLPGDMPPIDVDSLVRSGFTIVRVRDNYMKLQRFKD